GALGSVAWTDNRGVIRIARSGVVLFSLDALGADQTFIQSSATASSTLTVQDNVAQPQTVNIKGQTVQVQEGAQVLSSTSTGFLAEPSVAPLSDASTGQVYAVDPASQVLSAFQRDANTGALTLLDQAPGFVSKAALPGQGNSFGASVAVDGDYAVVGAPSNLQ